MKYLTLIWAVWSLCLQVLCAQLPEIIPLDSNGIVEGRRQGKWVFRYENGNLKAEGVYETGNRIGPWVFYWENGQIQSKGQYIVAENTSANFQPIRNADTNQIHAVFTNEFPIRTICPPDNSHSRLIKGALFEGIMDEFTEHGLWAYFDSSGYLIEIIEFEKGVWERSISPDHIRDP